MTTKAAAHAVARAFITALLEPTDAMQQAMAGAAHDGAVDTSLASLSSEKLSNALDVPVWMKTWKAGIEAALSELG